MRIAFITPLLGVLLLVSCGGQEREGPDAKPPETREIPTRIPPSAGNHVFPGDVIEKLGQGTPDERKSRLEEWRRQLKSKPAIEAAQEINRILRDGLDVPTGLPFLLKENGFLESAPTLRTFLLDLLEEISPPAARAMAARILRETDSPDEYALALRALGRAPADEAERGYVLDQWKRMIQRPEWTKNPSVGTLEAFDVAVHLSATELVPDLAGMSNQKENQAIAHAAFLTLDRLAQRAPEEIAQLLSSNSHLLKDRPLTRAGILSRIPPTGTNRPVLENYLSDPGISYQERAHFLALYPNANHFVSNNLLTKSKTPDGATQAQTDLEALLWIRDLKTNPRYENLSTDLEKAERRLQGFLQQRANSQ